MAPIPPNTNTPPNGHIAIIMGSESDWPTLRPAAEILTEFGQPYHCAIVSAHRTPEWLADFAKNAKANGVSVIIAGAGGAAHLPGMVASHTTLPVIGVPVQSKALNGLDSLLSIVQMPGGVPVATMAIGEAGAKNAALMALRILGVNSSPLTQQLESFAEGQKTKVLNSYPNDNLFISR